ncbi:MAG: cyclic peptide export ABC transporter [Proteobacteria bacterium]|nr:cyclic peptide export ABC transporter [Pseudomonadota bacterium]MBU1715014.1 cyclic peptide export ABC transporter [Pseudomonadota bacterium]
MELINFLRKESDNRTVTKILITSSLAGLADGILVVIINSAAQNYAELNVRYMFMFILGISIQVLMKKYSLSRAAIIARNAISETHIRLADLTRKANLASFEEIGKTRIYTTVTENTEIIFEASRRISSFLTHAIMVVFSFIYIAYLSITAFWLTLGTIVIGALVYAYNEKHIKRELHLSMQKENEFLNSLNHVLEGFKELKMNKVKSDDLFRNGLEVTSGAARDMRLKTEMSFISNAIFANFFLFTLLAAVVFLLPQFAQASPRLIISIVAILLFVMGPLGFVIDAVPVILKGNMAVEKLNELESVLVQADDTKETLTEGVLQQMDDFSKLSMRQVEFSYKAADSFQTFSVGPLNLTVKKGEIVFIVGGNGSGKTTMIKLLAGLYPPRSGALYVDDVTVTPHNYEYYRKFYSLIFTDFHLFDRMYGLAQIDEAKLNKLLEMMELSDKITCREGKWSAINLSTGQRKRLALIVALMEDRPLYIFDEVAADQDPHFRKHFYEHILKDLQSRGKTIIAVSHDDRYFHVADRVLKMEYGKIVDEMKNP